MRMLTLWVLVVLIGSSLGCGSKPSGKVGAPSSIPLPAEYSAVGETIAMPFQRSPEDNRDVSPVEAEAEIRVWASRLLSVESDDVEIANIAKQGHVAFQDLMTRVERIKNLPQPPGFLSQIATSAATGFYSGFSGDPRGVAVGFSKIQDNQAKESAVVEEFKGMIAAADTIDAIHMSWSGIAEKYAATPSDPDGKMVVDLDAAWGPHGPQDRLKLHNTGTSSLENCTIEVVLLGAGGKSRKNVHFVRDWPANSWLYTRYEPGRQILDRPDVFRTTIPDIQSIRITLLSPKFTTTVNYQYQGEQKDQDIARWCHGLSLVGRYQPFEKGLLWNTERGVDFTLDGIESIPDFTAHVTFRNGKMSNGLLIYHDGWKKGETKAFNPAKGELTFDPTHIDVELSFGGTSFRYKTTMEVR